MVKNIGLLMKQEKYNMQQALKNELLECQSELKVLELSSLSTFELKKSLTKFGVRDRVHMKRVLWLRSRIEEIDTTMKSFNRDGRILTESGVNAGVLKEGVVKMEIDENLGDVGGDTIEHVSAGRSRNANHGQQELLDMADFLARPVRLGFITFAYNTDADYVVSVWEQFAQVPSVRAKLRNYAYLRGNLHIRISTSGVPFDMGRILVSYQPYAPYNATLKAYETALAIDDNLRGNFLTYLSQAEGSSIINVNANTPVEIVCPFISTKPMFRLYNSATTAIGTGTPFDDMTDAGDLYISTLNQIRNVGTSTSEVAMQVYAWMTEAEFGTTTGTQVAIMTESQLLDRADERVVGPVERISTSLWQVANALTQVPFIEPFAKASKMVFGAMKGVAAIFGWSKPGIITMPIINRPEPYQNGAMTIGFDTAKRIVLDPLQELTIDPRIVGNEEDAMTLNHIASRISYYTTFTWDISDVFDAPIYLSGVSPCLVNFYSNGIKVWSQPTALAFAAFPFQFWRGDIIFRFEIVMTLFHRGKLAIGYEPNCAQNVLINTALALNKQYMKVVDIQESQVVDVRVPWAAMRPWMKTWTASSAYACESPSFLASSGPGYANGYIFAFPFTQLQSPDSSGISVNVYVYSDSLQLNGLSTQGFPIGRETYSPIVLFDEKEQPILTEASCTQTVDISEITLNSSSASTDGLCEDYFGEQPISFRGLLKRFIGNFVLTPATTVNTSINYLSIVNQIFPQNILPYGSQIAYLKMDLFSYLRYAYVGIKGSIRCRDRLVRSATNDGNMWTKCSLLPPSDVFTNSTTNVTGGIGGNLNFARMEGSVTFHVLTNGGIESEYPYYSNNLFQLCFSDSYDDGHVLPDNMEKFWFRNREITWDVTAGAGTSATTTWCVEKAAGEDFSLLRFQGAPFHWGPVVA